MSETRCGGGCRDYCEALGIPFEGDCCSSCLTDEEYGEEICESWIGDTFYSVCCTHAIASAGRISP